MAPTPKEELVFGQILTEDAFGEHLKEIRFPQPVVPTSLSLTELASTGGGSSGRGARVLPYCEDAWAPGAATFVPLLRDPAEPPEAGRASEYRLSKGPATTCLVIQGRFQTLGVRVYAIRPEDSDRFAWPDARAGDAAQSSGEGGEDGTPAVPAKREGEGIAPASRQGDDPSASAPSPPPTPSPAPPSAGRLLRQARGEALDILEQLEACLRGPEGGDDENPPTARVPLPFAGEPRADAALAKVEGAAARAARAVGDLLAVSTAEEVEDALGGAHGAGDAGDTGGGGGAAVRLPRLAVRWAAELASAPSLAGARSARVGLMGASLLTLSLVAYGPDGAAAALDAGAAPVLEAAAEPSGPAQHARLPPALAQLAAAARLLALLGGERALAELAGDLGDTEPASLAAALSSAPPEAPAAATGRAAAATAGGPDSPCEDAAETPDGEERDDPTPSSPERARSRSRSPPAERSSSRSHSPDAPRSRSASPTGAGRRSESPEFVPQYDGAGESPGRRDGERGRRRGGPAIHFQASERAGEAGRKRGAAEGQGGDAGRGREGRDGGADRGRGGARSGERAGGRPDGPSRARADAGHRDAKRARAAGEDRGRPHEGAEPAGKPRDIPSRLLARLSGGMLDGVRGGGSERRGNVEGEAGAAPLPTTRDREPAAGEGDVRRGPGGSGSSRRGRSGRDGGSAAADAGEKVHDARGPGEDSRSERSDREPTGKRAREEPKADSRRERRLDREPRGDGPRREREEPRGDGPRREREEPRGDGPRRERERPEPSRTHDKAAKEWGTRERTSRSKSGEREGDAGRSVPSAGAPVHGRLSGHDRVDHRETGSHAAESYPRDDPTSRAETRSVGPSRSRSGSRQRPRAAPSASRPPSVAAPDLRAGLKSARGRVAPSSPSSRRDERSRDRGAAGRGGGDSRRGVELGRAEVGPAASRGADLRDDLSSRRAFGRDLRLGADDRARRRPESSEVGRRHPVGPRGPEEARSPPPPRSPEAVRSSPSPRLREAARPTPPAHVPPSPDARRAAAEAAWLERLGERRGRGAASALAAAQGLAPGGAAAAHLGAIAALHGAAERAREVRAAASALDEAAADEGAPLEAALGAARAAAASLEAFAAALRRRGWDGGRGEGRDRPPSAVHGKADRRAPSAPGRGDEDPAPRWLAPLTRPPSSLLSLMDTCRVLETLGSLLRLPSVLTERANASGPDAAAGAPVGDEAAAAARVARAIADRASSALAAALAESEAGTALHLSALGSGGALQGLGPAAALSPLAELAEAAGALRLAIEGAPATGPGAAAEGDAAVLEAAASADFAALEAAAESFRELREAGEASLATSPAGLALSRAGDEAWAAVEAGASRALAADAGRPALVLPGDAELLQVAQDAVRGWGERQTPLPSPGALSRLARSAGAAGLRGTTSAARRSLWLAGAADALALARKRGLEGACDDLSRRLDGLARPPAIVADPRLLGRVEAALALVRRAAAGGEPATRLLSSGAAGACAAAASTAAAALAASSWDAIRTSVAGEAVPAAGAALGRQDALRLALGAARASEALCRATLAAGAAVRSPALQAALVRLHGELAAGEEGVGVLGGKQPAAGGGDADPVGLAALARASGTSALRCWAAGGATSGWLPALGPAVLRPDGRGSARAREELPEAARAGAGAVTAAPAPPPDPLPPGDLLRAALLVGDLLPPEWPGARRVRGKPHPLGGAGGSPAFRAAVGAELLYGADPLWGPAGPPPRGPDRGVPSATGTLLGDLAAALARQSARGPRAALVRLAARAAGCAPAGPALAAAALLGGAGVDPSGAAAPPTAQAARRSLEMLVPAAYRPSLKAGLLARGGAAAIVKVLRGVVLPRPRPRGVGPAEVAALATMALEASLALINPDACLDPSAEPAVRAALETPPVAELAELTAALLDGIPVLGANAALVTRVLSRLVATEKGRAALRGAVAWIAQGIRGEPRSQELVPAGAGARSLASREGPTTSTAAAPWDDGGPDGSARSGPLAPHGGRGGEPPDQASRRPRRRGGRRARGDGDDGDDDDAGPAAPARDPRGPGPYALDPPPLEELAVAAQRVAEAAWRKAKGLGGRDSAAKAALLALPGPLQKCVDTASTDLVHPPVPVEGRFLDSWLAAAAREADRPSDGGGAVGGVGAAALPTAAPEPPPTPETAGEALAALWDPATEVFWKNVEARRPAGDAGDGRPSAPTPDPFDLPRPPRAGARPDPRVEPTCALAPLSVPPSAHASAVLEPGLTAPWRAAEPGWGARLRRESELRADAGEGGGAAPGVCERDGPAPSERERAGPAALARDRPAGPADEAPSSAGAATDAAQPAAPGATPPPSWADPAALPPPAPSPVAPDDDFDIFADLLGDEMGGGGARPPPGAAPDAAADVSDDEALLRSLPDLEPSPSPSPRPSPRPSSGPATGGDAGRVGANAEEAVAEATAPGGEDTGGLDLFDDLEGVAGLGDAPAAADPAPPAARRTAPAAVPAPSRTSAPAASLPADPAALAALLRDPERLQVLLRENPALLAAVKNLLGGRGTA